MLASFALGLSLEFSLGFISLLRVGVLALAEKGGAAEGAVLVSQIGTLGVFSQAL